MGRQRRRVSANTEQKRLESLPWSSSIPDNDDPFALFSGSSNLEGGFLSLEEIDEGEYNLEIPEFERESEKKSSGKKSEKKNSGKAKKRKRVDDDQVSGEEGSECDKIEDTNEPPPEVKEVKKTKKKRKAIQEKLKAYKEKRKANKEKAKKEKNEANTEKIADNGSQVSDHVLDTNDSTGEEDGLQSVDEYEYSAWNELRLHPSIMKSIYRLGFKEPTPIQKTCIPAAAHQGKDVIGAAETGSGKTLAFGLPILQRLLDEQEKAANLLSEDAEARQRIAPRGLLRALIITPTRELAIQVCDHLKEAAKGTVFRVVPIVGGMAAPKQERLLRARPEIIVGTPGRLWELMSGGEQHLVELHSLSFFILDEADRMIETGHFRELQSIIDMLPESGTPSTEPSQQSDNCVTVSSFKRKKRQTFVFSATIALSSDFRKKLKRGSLHGKQLTGNELTSIENLSQRAGMRADAAVVDLTNASILANKLEESFLECREEDKDAYLYYILSVHGQGRTIVFCTSIAALRHISSILRILNLNIWALHAQMQQRARLKAMDRFRANQNGILIATDVAARGLDIPGVRTVVHYQLPHSAEVYVHRSGRTARAASDGCSVALISSNDRSKFASLCKSFSKDTLHSFPVESSYMMEIMKRVSLARQIDRITRKESQEKATETWVKRSAESVELDVEDSDSEEERVHSHKKKKQSTANLNKLQQELNMLLSRPLQPKSFSHRYLAGAGVSHVLQSQLEEMAAQKNSSKACVGEGRKGKLVVIGQDAVEPLQALRRAGTGACIDMKQLAEKQRNMDNLKRKRKERKKRMQEEKRQEKRKRKEAKEAARP